MIHRRSLSGAAVGLLAAGACVRPPWSGVRPPAESIMTVRGPIPASALGRTLAHEHISVDFIGAAKTSIDRCDEDQSVLVALPALLHARRRGVQSLVECTPDFLGRRASMLRRLADATGLQILTNTGLYGAVGNRYLPPYAFTEDANALCARWFAEWQDGIDGSGVRPGFIKLGVDAGRLSPIHETLVRAAARLHLRTGMSIAIHTGDGVAALDEIRVMAEERVAPGALIWVHAQNDPGPLHLDLARRGAFISLDGFSKAPGRIDQYRTAILRLRSAGFLSRVLLSHDDGWSLEGASPCTPRLFGNGNDRPYDSLFSTLLPALTQVSLFSWHFSGWAPGVIFDISAGQTQVALGSHKTWVS